MSHFYKTTGGKSRKKRVGRPDDVGILERKLEKAILEGDLKCADAYPDIVAAMISMAKGEVKDATQATVQQAQKWVLDRASKVLDGMYQMESEDMSKTHQDKDDIPVEEENPFSNVASPATH